MRKDDDAASLQTLSSMWRRLLELYNVRSNSHVLLDKRWASTVRRVLYQRLEFSTRHTTALFVFAFMITWVYPQRQRTRGLKMACFQYISNRITLYARRIGWCFEPFFVLPPLFYSFNTISFIMQVIEDLHDFCWFRRERGKSIAVMFIVHIAFLFRLRAFTAATHPYKSGKDREN